MTETESKILIVDDIKNNRVFLSSLLEIENYSFLEAESGQEAINIILNDKSVGLVLLDYMMPLMNGLETLQIIRSKYSLIELPIIMVTALNETENIVNSLNAGANDYITKPVEISTAMARIHTHYTLSKLSRENKEKEQRFKTLSDLSFEGIVIHKDNIILDVNQKFASMFNFSVNHLIGKNLSSLFYSDETDMFNSCNSYREFKALNSTNEIINVEIISREIAYNNKTVLVTAVKDISERLNNENLYNKLQENLSNLSDMSSCFPICTWCNKIQNGMGDWQKADTFMSEMYKTSIKNSICPICVELVNNTTKKDDFLVIDKNVLSVKKNGEKIYLTLGEFNILSYLHDNQDRVISIDEILENVMKYPPGTGNPDSVRTHITRLRNKIEDDPSKPEIITNIPKAGYKFNNIINS